MSRLVGPEPEQHEADGPEKTMSGIHGATVGVDAVSLSEGEEEITR